jgi:hypothetical protein
MSTEQSTIRPSHKLKVSIETNSASCTCGTWSCRIPAWRTIAEGYRFGTPQNHTERDNARIRATQLLFKSHREQVREENRERREQNKAQRVSAGMA